MMRGLSMIAAIPTLITVSAVLGQTTDRYAVLVVATPTDPVVRSIDVAASINGSDWAAFTGTDGAGLSQIFVSRGPGQVESATQNVSSSTNYLGAAISNAIVDPLTGAQYALVASRERVSGAPAKVSFGTWRYPLPAGLPSFTVIGQSPASFDSAVGFPAINAGGSLVAFPALVNGSTSIAIFRGPPLGSITAFSPTATQYRPMIDDAGRVAYRGTTGDIRLWSPPSGFLSVSAGLPFVAGTLGSRPGLSDDGRAVAFSARLMSMPANLPGIWVSYQRPDGLRSLVAMAGGGRPDGIIAVTDEQRVGVRHVAVPGSSPPASVIEVVFHGSNAAGAGIFRAIIAVNAADGQPLGAPVLESLLRIGRPLPVGPGGAITSLDLYDPINQSGTILVRATLGTDTALVRILADSDGDGLLDNWETDGIPYTKADGTPDRYILPGANVLHKDLYVEVDSMSGLSLGASAKAMVEAAFANAPSPEITNPDGRPGINLHVILDDQNITAFEAQSAIVGSGWPTKASSLKRDWFGTATDRLDLANVAAIQAARAKAFRYCLVINNVANRLYGGLAELGGDDFVICVGGLSDEDKASVFMHEVGHTLGLDHGGGDDINGKPNYPSIMNYLLAYRNGRTWWRLDYSRCAMVTLDEYDLDETQVVTGIDHDCAVYTDYWLPINVVPVSTCGLFTAGQPITQKVYLDGITRSDYNGNCLTVDRDVAGQDLNNLATACPVGQSSCPSPDEPFVGYNDWQRVSLPFLNPSTASFAAAQAEEPTLEQYARLDVLIRSLSSGQCVADFNADGFLTFEDFDTFVTAFEAGNATADFNADGFLTFEDFDAFVAAFEAGC